MKPIQRSQAGRISIGKIAPVNRYMAPDTASPTDQKCRAMVIVHTPMMSPSAASEATPNTKLASSSGQSIAAGRIGSLNTIMPKPMVINTEIVPMISRATPAAEQVGIAADGRGVEVFGDAVMLAVVDDGPAHPGDDLADQDVERVAQVDVREDRLLNAPWVMMLYITTRISTLATGRTTE